jgi:hypothetical protein
VSDGQDPAAEEERHRRGLKFRRRDDYAVELLKEAQERLSDLPRVDRILLELGRFYNPYVNAPIVDLASRRAILEALGRRDEATARRLLTERLHLYAAGDRKEPETPGPAAGTS